MQELLNTDDLSKNLGVSGNKIHHKLLNDAAKQTGETKSRLVQTLIVKHIEEEVKLIKKEKNDAYFRACLKQRNSSE